LARNTEGQDKLLLGVWCTPPTRRGQGEGKGRGVGRGRERERERETKKRKKQVAGMAGGPTQVDTGSSASSSIGTLWALGGGNDVSAATITTGETAATSFGGGPAAWMAAVARAWRHAAGVGGVLLRSTVTRGHQLWLDQPRFMALAAVGTIGGAALLAWALWPTRVGTHGHDRRQLTQKGEHRGGRITTTTDATSRRGAAGDVPPQPILAAAEKADMEWTVGKDNGSK